MGFKVNRDSDYKFKFDITNELSSDASIIV